MKRPGVVTIAGSDSGGGAGIQIDLKTFAAFGVHGASAITAVTAQNSREVTAFEVLSPAIVEAQIDAVMSDLRPSVVKLGMLADAATARLVARKLAEWKPEAIVLDPVMVASSGARLLAEDAIAVVRDELVPMATVVTPNWLEAGVLAGREAGGIEDAEPLAEALRSAGARAILLKGGHIPGGGIVDFLFQNGGVRRFSHPRIENAEGHGTGCALASAVAANLALGQDLEDAAEIAVAFIHEALASRYAVGGSKENYLGIFGSET
jgi:hydroxymethylpyrimidine/phosphomethylpyrimidine kinase